MNFFQIVLEGFVSFSSRFKTHPKIILFSILAVSSHIALFGVNAQPRHKIGYYIS